MTTVANASAVTETCPGCLTKARPVASLTVRSLVRPEQLARVREGPYRICLSAACDIVYFSATDPEHRFVRSDLRMRVGQKERQSPIPVCYCFDWTLDDIERELRLDGTTTIADRIKEKIAGGFCHCETMNPQGSCCLGNVNRAVKEVRAKLALPLKGSATKKPGALLATLGAVFTAILGSACCWLPLLLIAFGFSAAGVASFFEQYRLYFLSVTFALLGVAWYVTYRTTIKRAWARLRGQPVPLPAVEACCVPVHSCCGSEPQLESEDCCRRFRVRQLNQVMLWLATVMILLFAFFPHWIGWALSSGAQPSGAIGGDPRRQMVLEVRGMTCAGCAAVVEQALRKVPGVADARVGFTPSEAVVQPEPGKEVQPETLIRAVEEVGFRARLKQ